MRKLNQENIYIKHNDIKRTKIIRKLFINFIIIQALIPGIKFQLDNHSFSNYFPNITLKIRGIGYNKIFGKHPDMGYYSFNSIYYPNQTYINGELQKAPNYTYYFNQSENYVDLIWDHNQINLHCMFIQCSNITEINFINFDTSQVLSMHSMFSHCESLTSLNLSTFDSSKVTTMNDMFDCCYSLTSIDFTNFDTSSVTEMINMFYSCISLTSLDLSTFVSTNVRLTRSMFYGCKNLEFINMSKFEETNLEVEDSCSRMFERVPNNIIICFSENFNEQKVFNELTSKTCKKYYCLEDWKSKQQKIINETGECIEKCSNDPNFKFEYNGKCYQDCPKEILKDDNNNDICKCELDKCQFCPNVALNNKLCTECNKEFYQKENDPSNLGIYINCYKNPPGYYLNDTIKKYQKCYYTCESCEIKGDNINNNCLNCSQDYNIGIKPINSNYFNCYKNCSYYHYYDSMNIYHCTLNFSCPNEFPKLIFDQFECVKDCKTSDIYKYEFNNTSIMQFPSSDYELFNESLYIPICNEKKPFKNIKEQLCMENCDIDELISKICELNYKLNNSGNNAEEENNFYDLFLDNIVKSFISEKFNTSNIDNGIDAIIEYGKKK